MRQKLRQLYEANSLKSIVPLRVIRKSKLVANLIALSHKTTNFAGKHHSIVVNYDH